ncbi:MAG: protein translocase subunit SecF [Rickettsiales bacterium]|nr:protein translocase subunit SecF [Rickettsiales bacterium]
MKRLRLVPQETAYDFIRLRWIGFVVSLLFMVATVGVIVQEGINFGIDFTGGILMEVRTPEPTTLQVFRDVLDRPEFGEVSLQHFGDDREVLIRIQTSDTEEQAALVEEAKDILEAEMPALEYRKIDYVGPTVGQELIQSGYLSLGVAFAAVLMYIWFRFEWQFGVGAVVALLHDAFIMVGFFALTRFDFGLTSIAAILTVIGYSINDSVVIYDRIRENLRKYKKMPLTEVLNRSINDTLSRTVMTGVTTILAAGALAVFGGEVLKGFSWALVFGVVVGTYSSVFVAAPILLYFGIRNEQDETAPAAS